MTVLEQEYMSIMTGYVPRILNSMEKLSNNVELLIKYLENENH